MSIFTRRDLILPYLWSDTLEAVDAFERLNGEKVLAFIQRFLNTRNLDSITNGQKTEVMLQECPKEREDVVSIELWIWDNWDEYEEVDDAPFWRKKQAAL